MSVEREREGEGGRDGPCGIGRTVWCAQPNINKIAKRFLAVVLFAI